MKISELRPAPGSRTERRRVGRGHGSGRGKTAGKGTKGQKARTGGSINPRFEGGQLPIIQRLPYKRGFVNIFRVEAQEVNLRRLERFAAGSVVGPEEMQAAGLIDQLDRPVKILGMGELSKSLTVRAHKFSGSARQKIEATGGTVEEI